MQPRFAMFTLLDPLYHVNKFVTDTVLTYQYIASLVRTYVDKSVKPLELLGFWTTCQTLVAT
jgi:hypothetical protein